MKTFENILGIIKGISLLMCFIFGPYFMYGAFDMGIKRYYLFFLFGLYMFLSSVYCFYNIYKKMKKP